LKKNKNKERDYEGKSLRIVGLLTVLVDRRNKITKSCSMLNIDEYLLFFCILFSFFLMEVAVIV